MKIVNFRLDESDRTKLAKLSDATGIDQATLVRIAIRNLEKTVLETGAIPVPRKEKKKPSTDREGLN